MLLCISESESSQLPASSYAALHWGRPPERPLNCKRTLHLGRFCLFHVSFPKWKVEDVHVFAGWLLVSWLSSWPLGGFILSITLLCRSACNFIFLHKFCISCICYLFLIAPFNNNLLLTITSFCLFWRKSPYLFLRFLQWVRVDATKCICFLLVKRKVRERDTCKICSTFSTIVLFSIATHKGQMFQISDQLLLLVFTDVLELVFFIFLKSDLHWYWQ